MAAPASLDSKAKHAAISICSESSFRAPIDAVVPSEERPVNGHREVENPVLYTGRRIEVDKVFSRESPTGISPLPPPERTKAPMLNELMFEPPESILSLE